MTKEEAKQIKRWMHNNVERHGWVTEKMIKLYHEDKSQPKTEPSRTCICVESARKEIGWYQETLCDDCHKPLDKNSQKQTP